MASTICAAKRGNPFPTSHVWIGYAAMNRLITSTSGPRVSENSRMPNSTMIAAVIVSSHVMDEAERCDRLLLMREGRVIADDTPAALLERTGEGDIESAFLNLVEVAR